MNSQNTISKEDQLRSVGGNQFVALALPAVGRLLSCEAHDGDLLQWMTTLNSSSLSIPTRRMRVAFVGAPGSYRD